MGAAMIRENREVYWGHQNGVTKVMVLSMSIDRRWARIIWNENRGNYVCGGDKEVLVSELHEDPPVLPPQPKTEAQKWLERWGRR
jgi:hypothetical protein